ncbi:10458_t:CDS:2 [Entrophospora sp. SA101]|nr:10458_t:CDS:2 [Entrophospora sp. SA101]
MPLLRASLGDLPNGHICLSSAERQSLASKARRNNGTDHAEIPLTSEVSWRTKALIRLLLTLRNIIIVNKNLLVQATGQAVSHPPRNTYQSPTVSSP